MTRRSVDLHIVFKSEEPDREGKEIVLDFSEGYDGPTVNIGVPGHPSLSLHLRDLDTITAEVARYRRLLAESQKEAA